MSKQCPQDGGFVGDSGCTHPNHEHSALVKRLTADGEPKMVTPDEATAALKEGFYVAAPDGKRIGFGESLLKHIEGDANHGENDIVERKRRLMFAVKTIQQPDRVERNHRAIPGRSAYAKAFDGFGILAITGPGEGTIERVYTYFPRRSERKRP